MQRSAGILLPVFSLPSPYGIGSLGAPARAFVDFLRAAGQSWWQILPVGPVGAGDSPYASASTFAGNPLLIDLEQLAQDGLLDRRDLASAKTPDGPIAYDALRTRCNALLRKAFHAFGGENAAPGHSEDPPWLADYALYMAARDRFGRAWTHWPDKALRRHDGAACARYRAEHAGDVAFHAFVQRLFFRQWAALKQYATTRGVGIIGDLPMYVSLDSADVWAERRAFLLDKRGRPEKVAGVPPDDFSSEGQLWGNPLYDWAAQKEDGFGWWIRRVDGAARLFDALRIDHFRALERFWAVPAHARTAREGAWEDGPGMDFLRVLTAWFPDVTFIAEDLGHLTPAVHALRERALLPGMRVLQFAFTGPANPYLPHHYPRACVCYTGTHDNDTLLGWYSRAGAAERAFAEGYLGASGAEAVRLAMLRAGQASVAELFIAQMQDYLALDSASRVNIPGTAQGNWRWRLRPGQLTPKLAEEIRAMTARYSRCERI